MTTITCHGVPNMEDLESLLGDVRIGLAALQRVQDLYDSDLWTIQDPPFAKFRHIGIHISILAGELAKLSEQWEHESRTQAEGTETIDVSAQSDNIARWIADLLIHAGQLANITGQDLYPTLVSRFEGNARRFQPHSKFSQLTSAKEK
jgi:hypothetical protein